MANAKNEIVDLQSQNSKQDVQAWLNTIKSLWVTHNKSEVVENYLYNFFSVSENPFIAALEAVFSHEKLHLQKQNSLAVFIMECFSLWINKNNYVIHKFLNADIQRVAFNFVSDCKNKSLVSLVVKNFNFIKNKLIFLNPIHKLISQNKFKEACQMAIELNLIDAFGIKDFVIPLVMENKIELAEKFIEGSRHHQIGLVIFLDNLLGKRDFNKEVDATLRSLNIVGVDTSNFHFKALPKLIQRLVKKFNLPKGIYPNLWMKNRNGTVQFLINKRFIDKTIGFESWEELISDIVGSNKKLQINLINSVFRFGSDSEVLYWAQKFEVPETEWPNPLKVYNFASKNQSTRFLKTRLFEEQRLEDQRNLPPNLHKLSIPDNRIHLIEIETDFYNFLDYVVPQMKSVGIDSEWKPVFGFETENVSLLQVATKSDIYILDLKTLLEMELPHIKWRDLGKSLFSNPDILKLGFDIENDLSILEKTLSKIKGFKIQRKGYLDLKFLREKLIQKHKFVFPFSSSNESSQNLSTLVELCLGKTLDKLNQFSNWEQRPLRREQIIYAALDAYCLLEVYDVICRECENQNIYCEVSKISLNREIVLEDRRGTTKKVSETSSPSLLQYKIVCGSMLVELGKELRRRGVDTIILGRDLYQPSNLNSNGPPTILFTQARKINKRKMYSQVYWITSNDVKNQFLEVLKYMKLKEPEKENYACSRCEECNSANFLKVTKSKLMNLAWSTIDSNSTTEFSGNSKLYHQKIDKNVENLSMKDNNHLLNALKKTSISQKLKIPPSVLKSVGNIFCNSKTINVIYICRKCHSLFWNGKNKINGLAGFKIQCEP